MSVLAACHKPEPVLESPTPSVEQKRAERAAEVPESMQRHWTFLNRIRQDDAFNGLIHRTMLTQENQIGAVLFSSVKPEQVSAGMTKVMTEMGREFPHEDVTVAVYQVATPPNESARRISTGKPRKRPALPGRRFALRRKTR